MSKLVGNLLTLERFLTFEELRPPLEFFEQRLIQKYSPKLPHAFLQADLYASLNQFARPRKLGRAGTELRCTFGGVSLVFDISFFQQDRLPGFTRKHQADDVLLALTSPSRSCHPARSRATSRPASSSPAATEPASAG